VLKKEYLKLTEPIFDDLGKLKNYSDEEWKDDWLLQLPLPETKDEDEDEIPF